MFSIFGCPMHFGVGAPGLKYSLDYLRNRYENLRIVKLPEIIMEEDPDCVLKNRNTVAATCQSIAQYMYSVFETGKTPLFLGERPQRGHGIRLRCQRLCAGSVSRRDRPYLH